MHSNVTFFTSFKAFDHEIDEIGQRSAAFSWKKERFQHVLAIGRDKGVDTFCKQQGFTYLPDVKLACDQGLETTHPMLRSIVQVAVDNCKTDYLCLINSDIIVGRGFHKAVNTLLTKNPNPFIIGVRYDVNLAAPVVTDEAYMKLFQRKDVKLHNTGGSDYFAFSKKFAEQMLTFMPDYVMGAAAWDNWLHWVGLNRSRTPICTIKRPKILHPAHGYRQLRAKVKKTIYEHPAVRHNMKIYKGSNQKAGATGGGWKFT